MHTGDKVVYSGNYCCWTTENTLHALDLETKVKKDVCLASFSSYAGSWNPNNIELDASNVRGMLEAGFLNQYENIVDWDGLNFLANHV